VPRPDLLRSRSARDAAVAGEQTGPHHEGRVDVTADCFAGEAVAAVLYPPTLVDVVALTTWRCTTRRRRAADAAGELLMLHASVWLGGLPLAGHDEPDWPTTDQSTPAPDGSDCRSAMPLTVPEV